MSFKSQHSSYNENVARNRAGILPRVQCLYMLILELSQCRDWITISNIRQIGNFYGVS